MHKSNNSVKKKLQQAKPSFLVRKGLLYGEIPKIYTLTQKIKRNSRTLSDNVQESRLSFGYWQSVLKMTWNKCVWNRNKITKSPEIHNGDMSVFLSRFAPKTFFIETKMRFPMVQTKKFDEVSFSPFVWFCV